MLRFVVQLFHLPPPLIDLFFYSALSCNFEIVASHSAHSIYVRFFFSPQQTKSYEA